MKTATTPENYLLVSTRLISPSPTNPRKQFDPAKLKELAGNLQAVGILQPLLARKSSLGAKAFDYELVCGERRLRAAQLAGLETVPVLVRELTDAQVLEIQYIENLQREDLTALEEAEGFAKLIASAAYTPDTLAAKLGKSRSHIYARLKLTRLSPTLQDAIRAGRIDPTKAGLIATVPDPKAQETLLQQSAPEEDKYGYTRTALSYRQLQQEIQENHCRDLKGCGFGLDHEYEDLPGFKGRVAACQDCPKRSGNMKEFPELTNPNTCTDVKCFAAKRGAARADKAATLREQGLKVLTEKQSEAALGWRGQDDYVKPNDTIPGSKTTWAAAMEKAAAAKTPLVVQTLVALSPGGAATKLLPKEEAIKAAQAAGVKLETPRPQKDYAEENKQRQAKQAARQKLAASILPQLLAAAASGQADLAFLRLLASNGLSWELRRRPGLDKLDEAGLRSLLLENTLGDAVDYEGDWRNTFKLACLNYDIDLPALEKAAQAAAAKPEKAAPDKTTKPSRKGGKGRKAKI